MRRSGVPLRAALALTLCSVGCVEPFRGSVIEALFERSAGDIGDASTAPAHPELRAGSHLALWAVLDTRDPDKQALVRVHSFALVPAVNPRSPCLIERETGQLVIRDCGADPECEFWKARAALLAKRDSGLIAVASVADGVADGAARVTIPARAGGDAAEVRSGIAITRDEIDLRSLVLSEGTRVLRPSCPVRADDEYCAAHDGTIAVRPGEAPRELEARYRIQIAAPAEGATPAERRAHCEAAFSRNPDHYVGNPRQLTRPLGGTLHGVGKGQDPSSTGFVGGAEWSTPYRLHGVRGLFVSVDNRSLAAARATPLPDGPAQGLATYLSGNTGDALEGVVQFVLRPVDGRGGQAAVVSVFTDLDEDRVQF